MSKSVAIIPEPDQEADKAKSVVVRNAEAVSTSYRIVRFRNRAMILDSTGFPHFRPLHKEQFDKMAYPILGGKTRGQMSDTFAYLSNTAEDFTGNEHYILFGVPLATVEIEANTDLAYLAANKPRVWNMQSLSFEPGFATDDAIWRCPYAPSATPQVDYKPIEFIMQLAGGDQGVYDDIMQSLAPLIMDKKPDGCIWWVGDGANGKSTLMDAIYRLFPDQLASLTVKRLTDGRDTPSLNGQLGNIVKESSEGRIDDTEIYKAIGTHENFRVHKFHSQDDLEIRGNLHHIFNANLIPAFNDKGFSARRRTYIVPFNQRFESDPTFETRTFTNQFFGELVAEMCRYAQIIKKQGYRYKWSATTLGAKASYDMEANNAEEYAAHLVHVGVVAFDTFQPVKIDYDNWCSEQGYVPLGIGNMRRALHAAGFERTSFRSNERVESCYKLGYINAQEMIPYGMGKLGMSTVSGFVQEESPITETAKTTLAPDSLIGGW
jgi:hypothetical protein